MYVALSGNAVGWSVIVVLSGHNHLLASSFVLSSRFCPLFSSPEQKAPEELVGWDSSRRPCVRLSTHSNINISETSQPIEIKFHLEHHWGGGKAA